ncbi:winged helix-turn-helix transcriptional regulator [Kribbella sp. NPDC058693]|uniref:Helix-turn-helix transcriptional regulator n=1 Tax=Kribbella jiaozuonensis TaxID=2575441 RepID=A0A4U3LIQ0_9ACTN|nr:helix-turn-helix domain-containing protein [Kribbella jiaozuonensis]TKK75525.1 helix-turn-helix transcriptional regulator [Kribbella jiaozuonensis]
MVTNGRHDLDELSRPGGNLSDPNCGTRLVLDRIGDKWTVLAVLRLQHGPMRFTQLRDGIGAVAPKVLTQTLRRLERDGLVTREVFAEVPPRVVYALTPLGESLIAPITAVSTWAEDHLAAITEAQAQYDASV